MTAGAGPAPPADFTKHPFEATSDEVATFLGTNPDTGLKTTELERLQLRYGENKLEGEGSVKWYRVLLKQMTNAMILVLVCAMALSYGVKDWIEGGVITAVIVLNISIGFFQEYSAEKKMDSLRALSSPTAAVLRDGQIDYVPSGEVVPGDIVMIKTGDTVPADLRLFETMNLECDEKILTGEALPVAKVTGPASDFATGNLTEIGIGDRINLAYSSSTVTKGRGRGIVIFTGMHTEIGRIASSMQGRAARKPNRSLHRRDGGPLQPAKGLILRTWDAAGKFLGLTEGTPLQIKLSKLAYALFAFAIVLVVIVFAANRFNVTRDAAIYAISTGIAMIPESLIAVLTITFVTGMTQMRKRKVLTRKLTALEALGGITNICSDKTGTLTQGKMVARTAWVPGVGVYSLAGSNDAADPTAGIVTFQSQAAADAADEANKESEADKWDRLRSAEAMRDTALTFDEPDLPSPPRQRIGMAVDLATAATSTIANSAGVPSEKMGSAGSLVDQSTVPEMIPELRALLEPVALCNLATVRFDEPTKSWQTTGDPTEIALQVFAHRFDHGKKTLELAGWKQLAEFPFDSNVKRMSVIYRRPSPDSGNDDKTDDAEDHGNMKVFTKGAVERIIDLCSHIEFAGAPTVLTEELKEAVLDKMSGFADQGLRVLAIARKNWTQDVDISAVEKRSLNGSAGSEVDPEAEPDVDREQVESGLTLLGLAGIYDPPRLETKQAVQECTRAGIRVHMLTGDHPNTAAAIGREVGIIPRDTSALPRDLAESLVKTAAQFDAMSDDEIDALPELPLVIARCAPHTKTRMIAALHRRGCFAAMTGDGVNDGPSLQAADVGIAMGLAGSDVAKGASDIVLTDDNFASIVSAIEEGRRMFDNIQKFVLHLLTSNVGEVVLLICGLAFQDSTRMSVFPLSPLQILWINMATSGFPAFGLGREKATWNVMLRPPHNTKTGVFSWQVIADMMVYGLLMGTLTIMTFVIVVYGVGNGDLGVNCNGHYSDRCEHVFRARAAVFAELTWMILILAWELKSLRRSMFNMNPHSESRFPFFRDMYENKLLFWSVAIGSLIVFPCVYIPVLNQKVFKQSTITWEWALSFGFTITFVIGIELWKLVKRSTGWFAMDDDEDLVEQVRPNRLRQGFFTLARIRTRDTVMSAVSGRGPVPPIKLGSARVVGLDMAEKAV